MSSSYRRWERYCAFEGGDVYIENELIKLSHRMKKAQERAVQQQRTKASRMYFKKLMQLRVKRAKQQAESAARRGFIEMMRRGGMFAHPSAVLANDMPIVTLSK